ncbi:hypothetical protein [Dermatobacter hominis]|uniref:hypothetical protein n=1 Tax=Dermatobacter hominis TaxID=2884263 RepID=UPI001D0F8BE9|nr:hypothetical protein [Dermatobacter hominis]UDY36286.1 hypothetical protein LH044_01835 [Dermatobacter hominis]
MAIVEPDRRPKCGRCGEVVTAVDDPVPLLGVEMLTVFGRTSMVEVERLYHRRCVPPGGEWASVTGEPST